MLLLYPLVYLNPFLLLHLPHPLLNWYSKEIGIFVLLILGAGLGGFVACRALSQRNNDPTKASRPWDIVMLK